MRVWPVFKELESVMDIQTREALITEINNFKKEALKMHIVEVLANTYEHSSLFDCNIDVDGSVIWYKAQARQLWGFWQAAKAQAVPEVITIGNELQSWVAVNSFSADDGEGVLPVVDANAIAEKIEELTGANQ